MKPARVLAALLLVVASAACGVSPTLPTADVDTPSAQRGPTFGGGE